MTAIPYSENQNEICSKIIEKITTEVSRGENEFFAIKQFFEDSYYFAYSFGKVNLSREKFFDEDLKLGEITFSTFRRMLYRILNFIEESAENAELNILWDGFGGEVLRKEDKNLVSFYVKE